jgi:hypothetical protein
MNFANPIIRLTTGFIDNINDVVIAGMPAFGTSETESMLAGQLGQGFFMDDAIIQYSSSTPVYGGHFRYVKLAAAATAVVRGQLVFWDLSVADGLYQVTTSEAGSVPGAQLRAGVVLNEDWTAGRYSVIQDVGPTYVKYRAALTAAPAGAGAAVYAAAAGAGADNGLADVVNSADPTTFSDVGLLQARFLGNAIDLPTNGGTGRVYLNFLNIRG